MTAVAEPEFIPALGRAGGVKDYDRAVRFWTRETAWRPAFAAAIAPREQDRILDVGCGTGSLILLLLSACPTAAYVGLDPDETILDLARTKLAGRSITFVRGFARDAAEDGREGQFDKAVSSLLFHQIPLAEKRAGIAAMARAVGPGGEVHIADYGRQTGLVARTLFRIIQAIDGHATTQPNADGIMDTLFAEAGLTLFAQRSFLTPTGTITLWSARRSDSV
jgi:ubiquinone/menaquinone biosynthesis C-methylase UbiE